MKHLKPLLLLIALTLTAALAYLPGLSGELIFDDRANLEPIRLLIEGQTNWQQVIFGNESGPLSRPVSMASFVINTEISGHSVWGLKAGNLVLHLVSTCLLFFFLTLLSTKDKSLRPYSKWLPFALAAIWAVHPLLVSTVLYVVQRMAILSALFTLATLISYIRGRQLLDEGATKRGAILVLAVTPLFILLAALSKENGLLAPLLCVLLELVYFIPKIGKRRPWPAQMFVIATLTTVAAGIAVVAIFNPDFVLDGYANRHFTVYERILTQGIVLFDYIGNLLIPVGPKLSLFRDNYPLSTGLLSPPTTTLAVLSWAGLITLAVKVRKTIPGFSAGLGFFLIGHAMESGIFPLMLYFEHRNYLPSIGIFWALAALIAAYAPYVAGKMDNPAALRNLSIIALVVVLAGATHMRARIWQSNELMAQQSLKHYPDSRLLRMELAQIEMDKPFGEAKVARGHMRALTHSPRTSTRMIGLINLINIDCLTGQEISKTKLKEAFALPPDTVEADLYHVIDVLQINIRKDLCREITRIDLADNILDFLRFPKVSSAPHLLWRFQFIVAKLYREAGHLSAAHKFAEAAWNNTGNEPAVGLFLARLRIELGYFVRADRLLSELPRKIPKSDIRGRALLDIYSDLSRRKFGTELLEHKIIESPIINLTTPEAEDATSKNEN